MENEQNQGQGQPPVPAAPIEQAQPPVQAAPPQATPPVPKIEATPESVAARLAASEQPERITQDTPPGVPTAHVPVFDAPPTAEEPLPFDLSKLSPENLIALKAALENAPLRIVKKGNPIVKMRRLNGRLIIDFGTCVNTLRKDELTQITSEVVLIPVKFMGDDGKPDKEFSHVIYRDFMNSEQVKCEVLGMRNVEGGFDEGEVESNERPGIMVEMHVTTVQSFFTVKLPAGSPAETVEIEGRIANA